jgi:hypothetical protein
VPSFKKFMDYFDANLPTLSKLKKPNVWYYKSPEFVQRDNREFIKNYNEW